MMMRDAVMIIVAGILAGALIIGITLAGIVFINQTQLIHLQLEPMPQQEQKQ